MRDAITVLPQTAGLHWDDCGFLCHTHKLASDDRGNRCTMKVCRRTCAVWRDNGLAENDVHVVEFGVGVVDAAIDHIHIDAGSSSVIVLVGIIVVGRIPVRYGLESPGRVVLVHNSLRLWWCTGGRSSVEQEQQWD